MKFIFLYTAALLLTHALYAQHTEIALHFNSGFFHYTGGAALTTTFININGSGSHGYANTPTGRMNGFSYGWSASIQRITRSRFLVGIDLGWESLESKEHINNSGITTPATGNSYLRNNYINCFPFAGYRFKIKNIDIDAVGGVEDAVMLSSAETDKIALTTPVTFTSKLEVSRPNLTLGLRAQLKAWYRNWGITGGYSYYLPNYYPEYGGNQPKAYGRYIRLGFSYRIK
jgi:hypothetical protein